MSVSVVARGLVKSYRDASRTVEVLRGGGPLSLAVTLGKRS